ncbi:hypothetical protein GXW71_00220 [Roseomonas hellenica]|uniref:Lipoprotein n=2 Tax=Plastoroseomonas hellenica TaxID=2687306 RepID=A0ABS5ER33_9PROT|nr:hypothetical protein [Plastoroseomonas hellenica]MBR0662766.1 hypothetical protein [Plastoroseomonas hellenica]
MKFGNRMAIAGVVAGIAVALAACDGPPQQSRRPDRPPRQASGNVIPPPSGIDPGIHAPMPPTAGHPMPVIPPPGAPGGDPRVTPR